MRFENLRSGSEGDTHLFLRKHRRCDMLWTWGVRRALYGASMWPVMIPRRQASHTFLRCLLKSPL